MKPLSQTHLGTQRPINLFQLRSKTKISFWNVRTPFWARKLARKLAQLASELRRYRLTTRSGTCCSSLIEWVVLENTHLLRIELCAFYVHQNPFWVLKCTRMHLMINVSHPDFHIFQSRHLISPMHKVKPTSASTLPRMATLKCDPDVLCLLNDFLLLCF